MWSSRPAYARAVRRLIRARRPLVALVVLVAALAIGYAIKAGDSGGGHPPAPHPTTATGTTSSGRPAPTGPSG
jgi:hypothetical protein